jgi:hypothetical protein
MYKQTIEEEAAGQLLFFSVGTERLPMVEDVAEARMELERALTRLVMNFESRTGMIVSRLDIHQGALGPKLYVVPLVTLSPRPHIKE